jgi:hypothetical protein
MHQSPEWFEYLADPAAGNRVGIFGVAAERGPLVGLVPVHCYERTLDFYVKRHTLWKCRLDTVEILGGQPLIPEDVGAYEAALTAITREFAQCDAIWIPRLCNDSYAWRYLQTSTFVRQNFLYYLQDGTSLIRLVELPVTFDDYMRQTFKGKLRQELKRQVRVLEREGGGVLKLRRYEAPEDVPAFIESATPVAQKAWQSTQTEGRLEDNARWQMRLSRLAEQGLFRSYVLEVGRTACAYLLGYQYQDVYLAVETGYDPEFGKYSPGTVAMLLRIEDLIAHRPPRVLHFGNGDATYKRLFSNASVEQGSVYLLRRNLVNRSKRALHASFRGAIGWMKRRRERVRPA